MNKKNLNWQLLYFNLSQDEDDSICRTGQNGGLHYKLLLNIMYWLQVWLYRKDICITDHPYSVYVIMIKLKNNYY